jgi:hypothetical protein
MVSERERIHSEKWFIQVCTLRLRQGRVSQVALRTPTSILLLSVLVAGILSPSGLCARMCERRSQAETQHKCSHTADPMSAMMHHHSAMISPPGMDEVTPVWTSRLCPANCDAAALSLSSQAVAQLRVSHTRIGVPDATGDLPVYDRASSWRADGGPPARISFAATFSILRI